jgi:hypothetical protein
MLTRIVAVERVVPAVPGVALAAVVLAAQVAPEVCWAV